MKRRQSSIESFFATAKKRAVEERGKYKIAIDLAKLEILVEEHLSAVAGWPTRRWIHAPKINVPTPLGGVVVAVWDP